MNGKLDVIAIGESLIELSSEYHLSDADCLKKYYGGDALSVAIAARRMGSDVGFITRVGDDVFKDYLLDSWQTEGLDISQVKIAQEQNGVYFISRPENCAKEFAYYRKRIAPSKLSLEDVSEDYISNAKVVYASGITQSLSLSAKEVVAESFKLAKKNGLLTAYDPNYSSSISTPETAKEDFNRVINDVDILFHSTYPTENLTLKNIDFKNSQLRFDAVTEAEGIIYPEVEIKTENVIFSENTIQASPKHPIKIC